MTDGDNGPISARGPEPDSSEPEETRQGSPDAAADAEREPEAAAGPARPVASADAADAPAAAPAIPAALEIVGGGLDLNLAASGAVRRASMYAAGMYLLLLGPVAFIFALIAARHGPELFDAMFGGDIPRLTFNPGPGAAALLIGGLAAAAVSIDIQNVAVAVIDARASGRRPTLRAALAIARRAFWPLIGASIIGGLLTLAASAAIQAVLGLRDGRSPELDLARQTLIQLVVSMPFAYIGAAIAIGASGPIGAVRWSVRLARRRWRLAFVIGLVNTATSLLGSFAIGAGGDILGRVATALGIGPGLVTDPLRIGELAAIVAIAIAAFGSLTMTVAALSVGPQVVAYRRLGGPRRDEMAAPTATVELPPSWIRVTPPPPRPARLITVGMWVVLALLAIVTATAIVELA
ncbi:MAG: hypothetical protein QOF49_2007 [Chloroflexota bacterium]|jgi:hypothetical protein|nr:hypothetical protein [Chloroflexota bacterium]